MIEINWIPILISFFLFGFLREMGKDVYTNTRNFLTSLIGWHEDEEEGS